MKIVCQQSASKRVKVNKKIKSISKSKFLKPVKDQHSNRLTTILSIPNIIKIVMDWEDKTHSKGGKYNLIRKIKRIKINQVKRRKLEFKIMSFS